jgi:hypothetical protein
VEFGLAPVPTRWCNGGMLGGRATTFFFILLMSALASFAQGNNPNKLVLKVDETTSGPFGGQKSSTCLRVYSDGKVDYASWWNSAASVVDKETGQKSRPEHTVSVEQHLEKDDAGDLSSFLESRVIKRLPEQFGPPHKPIDYVEQISIQITEPHGGVKQISTREFYVASLEEETHYPSALIVLMHKIDEIEHEASTDGAPTEVPASCRLKSAQN